MKQVVKNIKTAMMVFAKANKERISNAKETK